MGLAPAAGEPSSNLRRRCGSGRRSSGPGNHATRATLVVCEVALAVMLLVSAGLLGRSLVRLLGVNAGFDTTHLLTLEINSSGAQLPERHERLRVSRSRARGGSARCRE